MKCIVQRVKEASIVIDGLEIASINSGMLVFVGYAKHDAIEINTWLADKLLGLRIFADEQGKMNKSINDINGSILLVSNFTLCANTEKGLRPSFINAESPDRALSLFDQLFDTLLTYNIPVKKGVFGADMKVSLINDGPVTFIIEK